ncbi:Putative adhesin domain-containing protein OS=Streptomyces alboniger OX=132473 GN=CP975_17530 PE=4 SV=1 [Streptomyces alboniger]
MQKFATTAPVSAVLDIPAGRIQIIAADRADTTVEVRPANPAKNRDVQAAEECEVSYADGVLRIKAAEARNRLIGTSGALEVTVQLPAGSHVEAKATAAEFRGVGRLGDVAFDGGSGSVKLDEAASARLTGLDAHITVGRLNGPGEISTKQGDITVTEAVRGPLTLSVQQGDITVMAAHGVSAALDAGTVVGRIDNALKNTDGDGAALAIKATTTQGDITARSL